MANFLLISFPVVGAGCGGASSAPDLFGGDASATVDGGEGGTASADGGATGKADGGAIVSDGGTTHNGGPGGDLQQIACGMTSCKIPEQSCCVYEKTMSYLCAAGAQCPVTAGGGAATALGCSGAANCDANTVCCVFKLPNNQVGSSCKLACALGNEAQLCDPSAGASESGCSPAAGACSSNNIGDWGLPKGYATCGGIGNGG